MRASISAVGTSRLVVVGRRRGLKDRRGAICTGVGCDGGARAAHVGGIRLRSKRRRCSGAGLGHLMTHVRWDVDAAHVGVVRALAVKTGHPTCRHSVGRRERQRAVVGRRSAQRGSCLGIVTAIRAASPARSRSTRGKRSGCSSGLLNSAGVMVLVTCQSSASRERLLAVGIGALVWALARVDTAMARQRARITKGLVDVSEEKASEPSVKHTFPHRSHM